MSYLDAVVLSVETHFETTLIIQSNKTVWILVRVLQSA